MSRIHRYNKTLQPQSMHVTIFYFTLFKDEKKLLSKSGTNFDKLTDKNVLQKV